MSRDIHCLGVISDTDWPHALFGIDAAAFGRYHDYYVGQTSDARDSELLNGWDSGRNQRMTRDTKL